MAGPVPFRGGRNRPETQLRSISKESVMEGLVCRLALTLALGFPVLAQAAAAPATAPA